METKSIDELNTMIKWLDGRIKDWEDDMKKPHCGCGMISIQCREARNDYAGWIAERHFLATLRQKLLSESDAWN